MSPRDNPLEISAKVTLNASGVGFVTLGPQVGNMWLPTETRVDSTSINNIPYCLISIGNVNTPLRNIDQTYQAYNDTSSKISGQQIYPGFVVWAQFKNGDPGADATLTIHGIERSNYRRD